MLVLHRKPEERVAVVENERVLGWVHQLDDGRIGFEFPPEIRLLREEVLRKMSRQPETLAPAVQKVA